MKKQRARLGGVLKREFEKDLELFKYILVLLNDASSIRNVELMWAEDLDLFESKNPIAASTGQALVQLNPVGRTGTPRATPSNPFCDLVHGFGAYVEHTCGTSDDPAKERCRAARCSQVYPCHVGLTDIAVPVICGDTYLGTLFSGQVLTELPTAEGFARVTTVLAGQTHVDMAKLEEAYFKVPVVTQAQLTEMVRMLEVFARYIANTWKRLQIMSEFQRVHERELALERRELAALLLSGQMNNEVDVASLVRKAGLRQIPTRVLVLRLPAQPDTCSAAPAIGGHQTLHRISHIVEDLFRRSPDTLSSVVGSGELCILTGQQLRDPGREGNSLEGIIQAVLRAVRAQGIESARIGVSAAHIHPHELLRGYNEACSALESGHDRVSFFATKGVPRQLPIDSLSQILKALECAESSSVTLAIREFLAHAAPSGTITGQTQQWRGLLTWASEHVALEIIRLGADAAQVHTAKEQTTAAIFRSPSPFAMAEAFRLFVENLRQEMARTFSKREEKIVMEVHRMVRELDPDQVTIGDVATALRVSPGHLSRLYSRNTGMTLEEYLIRQRVGIAKRLLLDPRLNVAEIANRCGFCNPAYFSSVFRKYMHCTPREYARAPQLWNTQQNGSFAESTEGTPPLQATTAVGPEAE